MTDFSAADHAHEHAVSLDEIMEPLSADVRADEYRQDNADQLMHVV
jgi:hypothetical protein